MRIWVKICGLTEAAAVDAALDAGADAIGFVFAPSPRQVSIGAALELKRYIGDAAQTVAVMRHPVRELAAEILRDFRPDLLQADKADISLLSLPPGCEYLPVLREGRAADVRILPERILYEGEHSGVGQLANWDVAHELARRTRLVLAGGLNPDNVTEAIRLVRPWGVDVSSGVETTPGRKDPGRVRAFVEAVRETEAQLEDDEDMLA